MISRTKWVEVDLQNRGGVRLGAIAFWTLLVLLPVAVPAQSTDPAALPDSPQAASAQQPQQPGGIGGTVIDPDGEAIAGATVTLTPDNAKPAAKDTRTAVADSEGYFAFLDLSPGNYKLTASSDGFGMVSRIITLHPAEELDTPDITLPVASADMDVEVSLTEHDQAEEDLRVEEKQRLLGVIPNFYVSYSWTAPALSPQQKFKLAWRSIIDPTNFGFAALIAGIEQATNAFPGYQQGAQGFGKRYGASLADGTVGSLLGGAVFPALLHQDPRYFYKGKGSVMSRVLYALATAFVCRGDNGKWEPNYSSVLADVASGAISNTYYPASNRNGATATVEIGLLNAAEDGFSNILQEFVFRRISTGLARNPAPKPQPDPAPAETETIAARPGLTLQD